MLLAKIKRRQSIIRRYSSIGGQGKKGAVRDSWFWHHRKITYIFLQQYLLYEDMRSPHSHILIARIDYSRKFPNTFTHALRAIFKLLKPQTSP